MRTVKYINRDYVSPVDLNTLGQTFNTLEQGHQNAIKAASDLEVAMANLDLNEAESEWRQQKINEIRQTIDDNTVAGNAYSALDDIIAKSGNLASDPQMIGKLQAQNDFKAFQDRVNKLDLPQDYKDYYLEKNKYYYNDITDDKGNIIGGSKWTPSTSPTAMVDLSSVINKGISWAAKDSGKGQVTRFFDKDGNVITNPTNLNDIFDGEVLNTTTNQWEKLPREKIWQGINAAIESTPGAKESIEQDYKVAEWKHQKRVIANNGRTVIDEFTDSNGVSLSREEYLFKRIDPAVQAAQFNNRHSITTWGKGLSTYKAALNKDDDSDVPTETWIPSFNTSSQNVPIRIKYDTASELQASKQNNFNTLSQLYKNTTGKDIDANASSFNTEQWDNLLNEMMDTISNQKVTKEQAINLRYQFKTALRQYQQDCNNYQQIVDRLPNEEAKQKLDFVNRMENGGKLNPNNPYDQQVISSIDNLKSNGVKYIQVEASDEEVYKNLITILDGDKVGGIANLNMITGVNSDGRNYIKLSLEDYNNVLLLSKANNDVNARFGAGLKPTLSTDIKYIDENNQYIDTNTTVGGSNRLNNPLRYEYVTSGTASQYVPNIINTGIHQHSFTRIGNLYTDLKRQSNKEIKEVTPIELTFSNPNMPGSSFAETKLNKLYDLGVINNTKYGKDKQKLDSQNRADVIGANYAQIKVFSTNEDGTGVANEVVSSKDRIDIGNDIKTFYGSNQLVISNTSNPILGTGSNITIYPKLDDEGKPKGIPKTYFIPNLIQDEAAEEYMRSPSTIATNKVLLGNEIKNTLILSTQSDTPYLGEQNIICNGFERYTYECGDLKVNVNQEGAINIYQAIEELVQWKYNFYDIDADDLTEKQQERLDNQLEDFARRISENSGIPINNIYNKLKTEFYGQN